MDALWCSTLQPIYWIIETERNSKLWFNIIILKYLTFQIKKSKHLFWTLKNTQVNNFIPKNLVYTLSYLKVMEPIHFNPFVHTN